MHTITATYISCFFGYSLAHRSPGYNVVVLHHLTYVLSHLPSPHLTKYWNGISPGLRAIFRYILPNRVQSPPVLDVRAVAEQQLRGQPLITCFVTVVSDTLLHSVCTLIWPILQDPFTTQRNYSSESIASMSSLPPLELVSPPISPLDDSTMSTVEYVRQYSAQSQGPVDEPL